MHTIMNVANFQRCVKWFWRLGLWIGDAAQRKEEGPGRLAAPG